MSLQTTAIIILSLLIASLMFLFTGCSKEIGIGTAYESVELKEAYPEVETPVELPRSDYPEVSQSEAKPLQRISKPSPPM